jgi:hypothetical protein
MSLREQMLLTVHGLYDYARWEVDRLHTSPHSTDYYRRPATVEAYLGLIEAYRPCRQWWCSRDFDIEIQENYVFAVLSSNDKKKSASEIEIHCKSFIEHYMGMCRGRQENSAEPTRLKVCLNRT